MKTIIKQLVFVMTIWGCLGASTEAKSIVLTTYYPPPNGAFDQLRMIPSGTLSGSCNIGSMYLDAADSTLKYCANNAGVGQWQYLKDGIWSQSGSRVIATPSIANPAVFLGIGTTTPEFKLSIENNSGIIAKGAVDSGASLSASGPGTYFLWYPRKSAVVRGTNTKDIDFGLGTQISTVNPHVWDDTLIGKHTVVAGGQDNAANYLGSAVGGGKDNLAGRSTNSTMLGDHNVVIGGLGNKVFQETGGGGGMQYCGVLGGSNNITGSVGSGTGAGIVILGGDQNKAGWVYSAVGGGSGNDARYGYTAIAGGKNNTITGVLYSSIAGGFNNQNQNIDCTIVGGQNNRITAGPFGGGIGENNSNGGGTLNGANFIGGGNSNLTGGSVATVAGGANNIAINSGIVLGGSSNILRRLGVSGIPTDPVLGQNAYSGIAGGLNNLISIYTGNLNAVLGGMSNRIYNTDVTTNVEYSLAGGVSNLVSKGHVFAWGHGGAALIPATANYSAIPAVAAPLVDANVPDVFTIRTGRVGIGTIAPAQKLHVNGNVRIDNGTLVLTSLANVAGVAGKRASVGGSAGVIGKDLAEVLDSVHKVEAGDVLSLTNDQKVQKTDMAYDTKVIGIASTAPAIFLQDGKMVVSPGERIFTEGTEVPLALKGRTLCKVTNEGGSIKPGDLLTSSSIPGYAMKANDADRSDHAIIGKALQSFNPKAGESSTGKIVILVTLQ